jgi:hypothetical protein
MTRVIGKNHDRLSHRNNACDSDDPNNSIDADQYVIAAIWKNKAGPAGQLYIYSELGLFSKSGFINGNRSDKVSVSDCRLFWIWHTYRHDSRVFIYVSAGS